MINSIYSKRRKKLNNLLPDNTAILIPGADLKLRNSDSSYAFRQDSTFYYFSGFEEPSSLILIIKKDNQIESIIFVPKKDKLKEIWDGFREGPEGAVSNYKFDSAFNVDEIHEIIPDLLHGKHKVFYAFGKKEGFDEDVIDWTLKANKKDRHSQSIELADSTSIIGNMRLIKDDHEINIIKKACEISADAHITAMKSVKPGLNEQSVEALYLYEFSKKGGRYPAYTPIVAGGENACILHYVKNNQKLNDSDLLLVDAGCEYEMYASDITRTYPINGKFSEEQLAIYKVVLDAHKAATDAVKSGNNIMQPQKASESVITEGLIALGILKGEKNELIENDSFKDFYMHKVGHWLGLDVHDSGDYMENGEHMTYKPGMITTIEPGIYISSSLDVEERWKGIGIRIEDDILVTESGNINLTKKVPTDPNEIEALMA